MCSHDLSACRARTAVSAQKHFRPHFVRLFQYFIQYYSYIDCTGLPDFGEVDFAAEGHIQDRRQTGATDGKNININSYVIFKKIVGCSFHVLR